MQHNTCYKQWPTAIGCVCARLCLNGAQVQVSPQVQVSLCFVEAKRRFSVDEKAVPLLNIDSF